MKKLGLLPDSALDLDVDEQDGEDVLLQDIVNQASAGKSKHSIKSNRNLLIDSNEYNCVKSNVKSGKFAKANINIVRSEQWPHTAVARKYIKCTTFDNMDFEMFVAGETKIVLGMLGRDIAAAIGRLRVLSLVSHWLCRCRNWNLVRGLYEGIIEEVETGESEWGDDFTGYETMLPVGLNTNTQVSGGTLNLMNPRPMEVYWCKKFQNGQCELNPPHMAQIKPDENLVPVLHICAACWSIHKKRWEHAEGDPACPSKK